jgi:glycosyltransferase involved in cell wall biosynthesis
VDVRRISLVVPMFNEADNVGSLVADVAAQDFAGEVDLVVADGASTDGSQEILRAAARRHGVSLTTLENPSRWVSSGLNAAIRHADGDLIVRLDCHARYPRDYLRRLAVAAEETGAWNVGGVVVPEGRTATERAVACAMDSPFGGIGWSRHGSREGRIDVDTVTFGAFRPEAFARAGFFDEALVRNQDDELNLRLRRAGGRIVLDPEITVRYTPRGSYRALLRQYHDYGLWKVAVMRKHRRVLSARSIAPLAFVTATTALAAAGLATRTARRALAAELAAYAALAHGFGAASMRRRGEPARLLPRVVAAYPVFHAGYGAGMARGLVASWRWRPSKRPTRTRAR